MVTRELEERWKSCCKLRQTHNTCVCSLLQQLCDWRARESAASRTAAEEESVSTGYLLKNIFPKVFILSLLLLSFLLFSLSYFFDASSVAVLRVSVCLSVSSPFLFCLVWFSSFFQPAVGCWLAPKGGLTQNRFSLLNIPAACCFGWWRWPLELAS